VCLLEENNNAGLVEANAGRLWGQLCYQSITELSGTIVLEATNDLPGLGRRLTECLYGLGAETSDALVVCRESDRALVDQYLASRFHVSVRYR